MRLWSIAQKVLAGGTRGYTHHPQLDRFRAQASPLACIATYLREIAREASHRGYSFDESKVRAERHMMVSTIQLVPSHISFAVAF